MINDSCWLIILVIFALIIFYSNNKISNTIEDYRVEKNVTNNNSNNLENYRDRDRDRKRIRDANVFVGECPFRRSDLFFYDDNQFGSHSIYEVGRISPVIIKNDYYPRNYNSDYANYYSEYV